MDRLVGGYKMPTDKFRLKVVSAVVSGGLTLEEAAQKYDIVEPMTIQKWISKFNSDIPVHVSPSTTCVMPKKKGKKNKQIPQDSSQDLEKALADAKLKILALETMITVAEEQFKIDIRKKPGTKQ